MVFSLLKTVVYFQKKNVHLYQTFIGVEKSKHWNILTNFSDQDINLRVYTKIPMVNKFCKVRNSKL